MVFFLSRRRPCLRSLDFYFYIVSSNFCFMKQIFFLKYNSKIILSVRILRSKIKVGAKIIPTQQFSNSNGIGLKGTQAPLTLFDRGSKMHYQIEANKNLDKSRCTLDGFNWVKSFEYCAFNCTKLVLTSIMLSLVQICYNVNFNYQLYDKGF